ncbi:hypothetical protein PENTCL1PPCAC_21314, partial [Pristionchus entomophagus]
SWMLGGAPEHIHLSTSNIEFFGASEFMEKYSDTCINPSLYIGSKEESPQMTCNPTAAELTILSKFTNLHLNNMFIRSDKFMETILKRYRTRRTGEWHVRTANSIFYIM